MIDKSNKYDILNLSAEDADFLCLKRPRVCAEKQTVSSAEHRNGAFLLEIGMLNKKEYDKKWRKENQEQVKECWKKWYGENQEKIKAYRKIHRKRNSEYGKEWRKRNPNWRKEWRHKTGESKDYREVYCDISKTKEYKRLHRKKYKALVKGGGDLTIKTIQMVYEDNIKKFGTLTCYLCLLPVLFSKDHLEHKTPLSRGGTNARENLGIACQHCNCKKHNKTEAEYRKEI